MSKTQIINNLKFVVIISIIFAFGIFIIKLASSSLLTINTKQVIKTSLFRNRDVNDKYYNYMNIFEKNILLEEYDAAYSMIDEYNAKEKFLGLDDFKEKMLYIYSDEKNYQYNIEDIIKKERYTDIYINTYISYKDIYKIETSIVQFMIREYSSFDYKIYLRTNIDS